MNIWEGIGSSIVAAVISALVAVLVVHLSNAASRRSWYHQRRIEAFAVVLDTWHHCWDITHRDWDSYPPRETTPLLPVMEGNPDRAPIIDSMLRRDQDLKKAVDRTRSAIEQWSLYLDDSGAQIEAAMRRAVEILYGEWDYSSYLGRGGLYLPIPEEFTDEWDRYIRAAHNWHRITSASKRTRTDKQFKYMWRSNPKNKSDIMEITDEIRFNVE